MDVAAVVDAVVDVDVDVDVVVVVIMAEVVIIVLTCNHWKKLAQGNKTG